MFREVEAACERECVGKTGVSKVLCIRQCVSPSCYRDLYQADMVNPSHLPLLDVRWFFLLKVEFLLKILSGQQNENCAFGNIVMMEKKSDFYNQVFLKKMDLQMCVAHTEVVFFVILCKSVILACEKKYLSSRSFFFKE